MGVSFELQQHIYSLLTSDATVIGLVDRVYDQVSEPPFGKKEAYISFGASDYVTADAECITAGEITQQIDIWSRDGGRAKCSTICDAVKQALHENKAPLSVNAKSRMRVTLFRIFKEPDGLTHHGVVQVTALIEEK